MTYIKRQIGDIFMDIAGTTLLLSLIYQFINAHLTNDNFYDRDITVSINNAI
ncbi:Uncharacterised protein [Serratia quinivorans]|jgi:hypothetical protein|nr:Uncharacterised protein [Serratia quinivorans]CAI1622072.1 Uncharacterised protein [Serratia quinivorans]CAI2065367.1 Uncharacterised protein [Serratia quinivorans]CAI2430293.1 Uncharacterised protein [Serratia quinivorans]CAI2454331.1 Uncharacterised protein [Serratia quinivorans]